MNMTYQTFSESKRIYLLVLSKQVSYQRDEPYGLSTHASDTIQSFEVVSQELIDVTHTLLPEQRKPEQGGVQGWQWVSCLKGGVSFLSVLYESCMMSRQRNANP
jgi:hypothetical protein